MFKLHARCPFCKSENTGHNGKGPYWVTCFKCGADGPIKLTKAEATVAWNVWTARAEVGA